MACKSYLYSLELRGTQWTSQTSLQVNIHTYIYNGHKRHVCNVYLWRGCSIHYAHNNCEYPHFGRCTIDMHETQSMLHAIMHMRTRLVNQTQQQMYPPAPLHPRGRGLGLTKICLFFIYVFLYCLFLLLYVVNNMLSEYLAITCKMLLKMKLYIRLESVQTLLKITSSSLRRSYLVIICTQYTITVDQTLCQI